MQAWKPSTCHDTGRVHVRVREYWAHLAFVVGMVIKGLDGVVEVVSAAVLFFIARSRIEHWVSVLAHHTFAHGPMHLVAHYAAEQTQHLGAATQHFAVAYLFIHGSIKLALVVGLLRGIRMVFPIALAVLLAFIVYQLYRLAVGPSWLLAAITVLDAIVVVLVWHEWHYLDRR